MNMIEKRKASAGQSGFTLVELLVVIAILAVLAGAAIIGIGAMRDNAKKQVCKTDSKTIETAAEAWGLDSGNETQLTASMAALTGANYLKTSIAGFSGATRATASAPFLATGSSIPC